MNLKKITYRGKLYAVYCNLNETKDGLSFISEDKDFIQVGLWKYDAKKILPAHFHHEYIREATRTCESIYVIKGKIKCNLYTKSGKYINSFVLNQNEIALQLYGAHEYEILEESIVLENKNGPYLGPKKDRKRINVQKN